MPARELALNACRHDCRAEIEIDGREYMDEVRVSRSQLLAGVGERYAVGVEFLWLRLPWERSLRSYAATLTSDSTRLRTAIVRRATGRSGRIHGVAVCSGRQLQQPVRRRSEQDRNGLCQGTAGSKPGHSPNW